MAAAPENLQYTKDHEWILVEGDAGTIGITHFAQNQLGDIVHVQLPRVGDKFKANDSFGEIESVKTFSELFIPVSGEVTEVNEALGDTPEVVNNSPYGDGWMIRIKISNPSELDKLLNSNEYEDFTSAQGDS
ncbi:MAG: glycine cleavage system protein GcvH [Acidobacteria bacterium]|nr:glycine cleavage system protein GcvH [Acidobacteriota bacterium]